MAELYDPELLHMIELATTKAAVIFRALGEDKAYWDINNMIVKMVTELLDDPTADAICRGGIRVSHKHDYEPHNPEHYDDQFRVSFELADCWV